MPYIGPRGTPTSRIWVILAKPYGSDKGTLFSGGMGHVFFKMLQEAGINQSDCYFTSRAPNTDAPNAFVNLDAELVHHTPPIVLVLGDAAGWFLPELREPKLMTTSAGQLQKYAGSLLSAPSLSYPHYMIPIYGPERCVADWTERNITTYVDLQKVRDEFKYWQKNGTLQALPERVMKYHDMDMDELLVYLERFRSAKILSDDIENPTYKSQKYSPHPGYPLLMGLADSSTFGISFRLFRDKPSENRELWRRLDDLYYNVPILLGQNFFNYDALFHNMLGFRIRLERVQDTLLRHHILWPELSHKLQFMTRQYTREPYYKDEGHGWTLKSMNKYRRYNCLDACVTREIYDAQEEEFQQRPQLR
jgi:uracil-DNA glycosylase